LPLNQNHQLQLLSDILRNHSYDSCGTNSECEQLHRLANTLLQNSSLEQTTRDALQSISEYGKVGSTHDQLTNHIDLNQSYINTWVESLDNSVQTLI
jgi:hypothetical protein